MGGLCWGLLGFPLLSPLFPFSFLFLSPVLLALGLGWQSSGRALHCLAAARGLPGEKNSGPRGRNAEVFFAFFREGSAVFSWNAAASQNSRVLGSNYPAREQERTPWRWRYWTSRGHAALSLPRDARPAWLLFSESSFCVEMRTAALNPWPGVACFPGEPTERLLTAGALVGFLFVCVVCVGGRIPWTRKPANSRLLVSPRVTLLKGSWRAPRRRFRAVGFRPVPWC